MEAVNRGTWDEFQKRCTLQHSHVTATMERLSEQVEVLTSVTTKLQEAVSGTSWFRQVMTGLVALALGVMYPQALTALKALLR